MCYSALVQANLKNLEQRFRAELDWASFAEVYSLRENYKPVKIPAAIDSYIIQNAKTMDQRRMAKMALKFYQSEIVKIETKISKYENDCLEFENKIKKGSKAKNLDIKLIKRQKSVEKLKRQIEHFKDIENSGSARIFSNYFAPVIFQDGNKKIIRLMRYQILPASATELSPSKYNLFNARRDRLLSAKLWKPLFGEKHAIFPFFRFYENVDDGHGGNKVIYFETESKEMMWSAAIFEECKVKQGVLRSFAAITDEPPPEVAETGHDRCPVYLQEDKIEDWLNPKNMNRDELLALLDFKTETYFKNFLAA